MHDVSGPDFTTADQQQLVSRILASDLFSKSHRLAGFLRFIFDQYSRGHASAINEQRIGTEVFGRAPGYHVGEDSIVRSQARFLRQRLEEYFANEGKREPVLLLIPKGSYVPAFERRELMSSPPPVVAATVPPAMPTTLQPELMPARDGGVWRYRFALAMLSGVAILLAVLLYRTRSPRDQAAQTPAVKTFWSSLFSPERSVLIVPADSTLVLLDELAGKPVHLLSYINKDYFNTKPPGNVPFWDQLAGSQYTSIADLNLVAHLERVPEAAYARPQIRYARELSLKELKDDNAILIGGLRANPWMEVFSSTVTFDVDYDRESHHNIVRNRAPGPTEQAIYIEDTSEASGGRAYGVVIYLPSLDNQGHTLLVEGTSKAGTEAAGEFLTSPAFDQFLLQIGATANAVPNFELLLSTGSMGGASYHPAVVCWHPLRKGSSN